MGNKYTATFSCERELWDSFKAWAKRNNSSASQEISKFMFDCISSKENISNLYQEKESLESLLRKLVIGELDLRLKDQYNTESTGNTETKIITDDIDIVNNEYSTDSTDDTDKMDLNELLTDQELKRKENLTQNKSTITRWRQGKGKIPEHITQNYQVVGSRWKLKEK